MCHFYIIWGFCFKFKTIKTSLCKDILHNNKITHFIIVCNMKKWFKIFFVILLFASISVAIYFILKAFNIASISTLKELINNSGKWAIVVYTLILIFVLVVFCFVPLLNTALAILGIAMFGSATALAANLIAIIFSTSILFFIGDKLGEKFIAKLIGRESLISTQNKIYNKSRFWLPLLFVAPGVPDEAVCLVAGMTKIKFLPFLLFSIFYHAIEIGLFCFMGSDLFNWNSLSLLEWIIVINIALIDLFLLHKLEKFLENKFSKD